MSQRVETAPGVAPGINRPVALWLLVCMGWVLLIAVVGGITRLTGSGLSIPEWAPLRGVLPPITSEDWVHAFDLYRASPQYLEINRGMTMDAFRTIFWWEWIHRLIARATGLVYALPLLVLWRRGHLPTRHLPAYLAVLVLGGLQGVIGWLMVRSGLGDQPFVSPLKLAMHLGLALIIASLLAALLVRRTLTLPPPPPRLRLLALVTWALLWVQCLLGALVAGLRAGWLCPTWPKMCSVWVPWDTLVAARWDVLSNPWVAQFVHRWWAVVATLAVFATAALIGRAHPTRTGRPIAATLVGLVLAQFGLGVWTLLSGMSTSIAVTHQAVGIILLVVVAGVSAWPTRAGGSAPS